MKIVLILPRGGVYRKKTGAFPIFIRYGPMTLPMLAALIPKELHAEVELYDEGVQCIEKEKITADLIGISSITGASPRAFAYADYFRSRKIPVVIGGVHATLNPDEAAKHADAIVLGIATATWPELLKDFSQGKMKSVYGPPDTDQVDFSHWPVPARKLVYGKAFITINSVQATYGCKNRCEFCVTPYSCKGYHHRPISDVVDEIRQIKNKYFLFVDPSPIEDTAYAKELYSALIPLKKRWMGCATIRIGQDDELLDLAARSGCRGLLIGFESISGNTLTSINKNFNSPNKYVEMIKKLHDKKIAIMGCFVFGLDSDDKDVFKRTVEFVQKNNIDLPRFTVNTPFPGTNYFDKMKAAGRITSFNWSCYDAQHVVIVPTKMTAEELQAGHRWAWHETYKWQSIAKRLLGSKAALGTNLLTNAGYHYYSKNLPKYSREVMARDIKI